MRNRATRIFILQIAFAALPAGAVAADHVVRPAELYGAELPADQVLPTRGTDLPIDVVTTGGGRAYTLAPQVQAIPTATAFQAGAFALAGVVTFRLFVRRRRCRATAL